MKQLIQYLTITIIIISVMACQTRIKYMKVPLTKPPEKYYIPQIADKRDLIEAYRQSVMRISQWQVWFNIQSETNYFQFSDFTNNKR
ncbi:putative uncharacterized protein [Brachyspira sp. CAG:700]|nr:putative uncharacterized protein [Brachyspira sp. CAG:700]